MKQGNKRVVKDKRTLIVIVLTVILTALLVVVFIPNGDQNASSTDQGSTTSDTTNGGAQMQELIIQNYVEDETAGLVYITTNYGNFSYPFAYSELLVIEAASDFNYVGLMFKANLNGTVVPAFNLWINRQEGTYAGEWTIDGRHYPLYVQLVAEPEIDPGYLQSFHAAQELLNDVLQSLAKNGVYSD